MSYASGLMMGTAIIQGLSQLLGGMASGGGGGGMRGGMGGMGKAMGGMGGMGGMGKAMGSAMQGDVGSFLLSEAEELLASSAGSSPMPKRSLALVSSLPGRRRYRLTGMTQKQAAMLEEHLARISYIKEAKTNTTTGSLLISYDAAEEPHLDALMVAVGKTLGAVSLPVGVEVLSSRRMSRTGTITRSIHNTMGDFSRWLKKNTGGTLDANSLFSGLLLLQGVKKLLDTQQFPSASQMIWWAVSLMRGWRSI